MFITHNQVRMHDTDMAGILYFPRLFRFAHDALEDYTTSIGFPFSHLFKNGTFLFVIVHADSNYYSPLVLGDKLEVQLTIEKIGTTSFTVFYKIYTHDKILAGTARTVHVALDSKTRKKIELPKEIIPFLEEKLDQTTISY